MDNDLSAHIETATGIHLEGSGSEKVQNHLLMLHSVQRLLEGSGLFLYFPIIPKLTFQLKTKDTSNQD